MAKKVKTPSYVIKYFGEAYNDKPTPKNVLRWLRRKNKSKEVKDLAFVVAN